MLQLICLILSGSIVHYINTDKSLIGGSSNILVDNTDIESVDSLLGVVRFSWEFC